MMQLMLSPLAQTIFSIIAVLCYVACAFRILCFDRLAPAKMFVSTICSCIDRVHS